jgi:DNA invertase Pin-like site-specific DNA recombinase
LSQPIFDLYIRVSKLGDRDDENLRSSELQEAACRNWAALNQVSIGETVEELNVSGAKAVSERELERLIKKVEAAESAGIITSYLDRFARDLIGGAVALKRIVESGGRLVCVQDGFDSSAPGSEFMFNIRMAIAQDYLSRIGEQLVAAQKQAAAKGVYLARKPPLGYRRVDQVEPKYTETGQLVRNGALVLGEREATLVRECFLRRAQGANAAELTRFLNAEDIKITKSSVIRLLSNRAYLGEAVVQSGKKGEPDVVKDNHPPLITEAEFDAAQRSGTYHPRNGTIAAQMHLSGLVFCATCGRRLKSGAYGKPGARRAQYVCTAPGCRARVSIGAAQLDSYVAGLIQRAVVSNEPHVVAILEGDDRYQRALEAVGDARRRLEEFRDDVELVDLLGRDGFKQGLRVRKEALQLARDELKRIPPSTHDPYAVPTIPGESFAAWLPRHEREVNAQFIDRVVTRPIGQGKRVRIEQRVEVYFVGADQPWMEPEGHPETMAILATAADAKTIMP